MITVYVEISKYLIVLLMAMYTFCNFRYFTAAEAEAKEDYCAWQQRILLLLHFIAFSVLYFQLWDLQLLVFYGAQLLFFLIYPRLMGLIYRKVSRLLLNNICMFLALGMVMLTRLDMDMAMRQFLLVLLGAALSALVPLIMDRVLAIVGWRWLYMILGLGLLMLVLAAGSVSYGAKMAIELGGFSFQPSEFVKLSFVFFTASMLYHSLDFKNICLTSGIAALHVLLLVACRDLGTALMFFAAYVAMLYAATGRAAYVLAGGGMFAGAGAVAYQLFSHVRTRVAAWRDPWSDITNTGYQIAHSLFAIGTGGLVGMGLGQGMPNRIPIVEKDFIFSAISEEMGAITAICLILICLGCFLQMMLTAYYMDMLFYRLVAVGLGVTYIFQVFLTIGGVTKFIPSTGVTLPFVAYGGSSVISSFLLFMVFEGMHIIMMKDAEAEPAGPYTGRTEPEDAADLEEVYPEEEDPEQEEWNDED